MSQPRPPLSWPTRFSTGLGDGLEPGLEAELQAGLRECAEEFETTERVARRAARRALDRLDARRARPGSQVAMAWARRLIRPKTVLAAIALAIAVQFGAAMAEELGPRTVLRIGDWLKGRVALLGKPHGSNGPAPTTAAPSEHSKSNPRFDPASQAFELAQAQAASAMDVPDLSPPSPTIASESIHRRTVVRSRRSRGPVPAILPDPLGDEAALVARLVALAGEDPRGALDLAGHYWRDYPAGTLRGEAAVAEVSALRSLGKQGEALARLDGWAQDRFRGMSQASGDLALLRLELMVGAGRCAEALPLLERQLAVKADARLWGRALLARAACKGKLGDSNGNRADLERYLRELPDGPRSGQVRRALGARE